MRHALFIVAVAAAAAGTSLSAHHSYSAYDVERLIEVEGVIDEFARITPHSLLKVKGSDGSLYVFEWLAPFALERRGVQPDALKAGDRIVVAGNPHRDFETNRVLNFKSVRRLADGWKWPDR